MKRRLATFVSAVAICVSAAALSPAASFAVDPILFVHGYSRTASDWKTMIGRFEKDGWKNRS